ncbi:hypothetical protein DL96DRAFT_1615023, partial [Flagelloscypha sp. PMI_526]
MISLYIQLRGLWALHSNRRSPARLRSEQVNHTRLAVTGGAYWRFPLEIIEIVTKYSDPSTLTSFALTCRPLLPVSRQRLYNQIQISSQNIRHLVRHSAHLLFYTRDVLFTVFWDQENTTKKDLKKIFEILIHHGVLTRFENQGYCPERYLKKILQIGTLPCLTWLCMELPSHWTANSLICDILRAPNLREVTMAVSMHARVPEFNRNLSLCLPALEHLSLGGDIANVPVNLNVIHPWTAWINLELLEQLSIGHIPMAVLPQFPPSNKLEFISYTMYPDLQSLALNIPILTNLKRLTFRSVSSSELSEILDILPPNPIPFAVTIYLKGEEVLLSSTERDILSKLMERIRNRGGDASRFCVGVTEITSKVDEKWVARMKEIFVEELGGYVS